MVKLAKKQLRKGNGLGRGGGDSPVHGERGKGAWLTPALSLEEKKCVVQSIRANQEMGRKRTGGTVPSETKCVHNRGDVGDLGRGCPESHLEEKKRA